MDIKRVVYFIARSEHVPFVLQEATQRAPTQMVTLFFDLDGTRALDTRYAQTVSETLNVNLTELLRAALEAGVTMYICQMNVMESCQFHVLDGIESAGVVTFLEHAYEAEAVFSY